MRPVVRDWLREYDVWHRDPWNRRLHALTVPLLLFHVVAVFDWITLGSAFGLRASLAHLAIGVFGLAWMIASPALGSLLTTMGVGFLLLGRITPGPLVVVLGLLGFCVETAGHVFCERRHPPLSSCIEQAFTGPLAFAARVLDQVFGRAPSDGDGMLARRDDDTSRVGPSLGRGAAGER